MKFIGYVLGVTCLAVTNLVNAATVSIEPSTKTVNVGDTFSLAIVGDFAENIVGGGFDLTFDPTVLKLNGNATIDAIWEFSPDGGAPSAGTLSAVSFNSVIDTHTGKFNIATVNFTALTANANSKISLLENLDVPIVDDTSNVVAATLTSAAVTVAQPVPLPSALLLLMSGLGTGVIKRRYRQKI